MNFGYALKNARSVSLLRWPPVPLPSESPSDVWGGGASLGSLGCMEASVSCIGGASGGCMSVSLGSMSVSLGCMSASSGCMRASVGCMGLV